MAFDGKKEAERRFGIWFTSEHTNGVGALRIYSEFLAM